MSHAFPMLEEVPGLIPGTPSGQSREEPDGGYCDRHSGEHF